ncbi:polysaccharide pyruvyl transferase family protein [Thalassotalea ganghwensis]
MKKIVLFGAFDRYNYGDNLMPILFQKYVERYAPHLLDKFEFEYVAISHSNLERYSCQPTKAIDLISDTLPEGSVIVVIGGEVLCCKSSSLFLHMQNNQLHHFILKVFRKLAPRAFSWYSSRCYSTAWEFPFIPSPEFFTQGTKVVFNTVGGDFSNVSPVELKEVKARLARAEYVSVRDTRTYGNITSIGLTAHLAPDSAYIMADLLSKDCLKSMVGAELINQLSLNYFVFQGAPNKIGSSVDECINQINNLAKYSDHKVVLLPIGYASGHDDYRLLNKIHKALPDVTIMLNELTLWEIMYVIANSQAYFGTSLHGAITAMSYGLPHFGINPKVIKLDAFLRDWSIEPFNRCYSISELSVLPECITTDSLNNLQVQSNVTIEKVKANYKAMLATINEK